MQYFVTGATGFIGKRLVKKLLERKGAVVHFLIRKESAGKVDALRELHTPTVASDLQVAAPGGVYNEQGGVRQRAPPGRASRRGWRCPAARRCAGGRLPAA